MLTCISRGGSIVAAGFSDGADNANDDEDDDVDEEDDEDDVEEDEEEEEEEEEDVSTGRGTAVAMIVAILALSSMLINAHTNRKNQERQHRMMATEEKEKERERGVQGGERVRAKTGKVFLKLQQQQQSGLRKTNNRQQCWYIHERHVSTLINKRSNYYVQFLDSRRDDVTRLHSICELFPQLHFHKLFQLT